MTHAQLILSIAMHSEINHRWRIKKWYENRNNKSGKDDEVFMIKIYTITVFIVNESSGKWVGVSLVNKMSLRVNWIAYWDEWKWLWRKKKVMKREKVGFKHRIWVKWAQ